MSNMYDFIGKTVNPIGGADSKNNGLREPDKYKILALIEALEKFTTVKKKENLWRLLA